jgi:hypothetical protein
MIDPEREKIFIGTDNVKTNTGKISLTNNRLKKITHKKARNYDGQVSYNIYRLLLPVIIEQQKVCFS